MTLEIKKDSEFSQLNEEMLYFPTISFDNFM